MELFDTHCHIQSIGHDSLEDFTVKKWRDGGIENPDQVIASAKKAGVTKLMCVGTDLEDSIRALEFAKARDNCWASIGVHPHEASRYVKSSSAPLSKRPFRHDSNDSIAAALSFESLVKKGRRSKKLVAIGEVGLDYHYEHSSRKDQIKLLEEFLQLAVENDYPVIFHVCGAYDDFWPILANFRGIRGVLHSFSADTTILDKALNTGLYMGLNGIMTFTKDQSQLESAKAIPVDRLVLETDAPYLAPKPYRGKVCKPEHVKTIAELLSDLRGEDSYELARRTTANAMKLFNL